MSERQRWFDVALRILCVIALIGLFIVDRILDLAAKPITFWPYAALGLVALGIEMPALRRLVLAAVRVAARIPEETEKDK